MSTPEPGTSAQPPRAWLRFLIPSSFGVALLLVPVPYRGKISIVLGHFVDAVRDSYGEVIPAVVAVVIAISAVTALVTRLLPLREGALVDGPLAVILRPTWTGTLLRLVGAVIAVLVVMRIGPDWLIGDATGSVILRDLLPVVFLIFFAASFVLPCLTDFGLMELVGGYMSPLFRPLFGLPGRSAVDALASWLGAASVGVLITADQYERGFYTERESAVIATTFSVVSVAFAYVIIDFVGLGEQFVPYYLTVVVSGLVAAVLCPLLPPLRGKPDRFIDGRNRVQQRRKPAGPQESAGASPLDAALERAAKSPSASWVVRKSVLTVLDIWLGLLPMVAVIGTLAIVVAETTPLFRYLGAPFVPLLNLLQIPEPDATAPAMVVGFADQFLPVVLGRGIDSELTRFVVACTCVNQLIYMSEVGVILLRSALPLKFLDLVLVFVVRTVVTVPVAAVAAHWLF